MAEIGYTLIIHVGNSNTLFSVFAGENFVGKWRLETRQSRTADEYGFWLLQVLERENIRHEHINGVCISTVVPHVETDLTSMARRFFHLEPFHVLPGVRSGFNLKYGRLGDLGPDRLANIVALKNGYKTPAIVVDFGRITSFDVIDEHGEYKGGLVAPGMTLALESMARVAPRLPDIGKMKPEKVIGLNIVDSMQSGSFYGAVDMVSGLINRIWEELNTTGTCVATGGYARDIVENTDIFGQVDTDLTLKGLKLIYDKNRNLK